MQRGRDDQFWRRRFGARTALGLVGLLAAAVPFLLLWLLIHRRWTPLAALDQHVATRLNEAVSDTPTLVGVLRWVTDLGGNGTAAFVLTLATVFLVIRRSHRLATFTVVTGIGLAVLVPVTKLIVDRARPLVASPVVATPDNPSFPSGHAMTAVVTWGVLLLLVLPAIGRRARPWLVTLTILTVLAVGFTRLALGVHYVSDVLAGWTVGAGWLAVSTAAFRGWQHDLGRHADEPLDPLDVTADEVPQLVGGRQPALPRGWTTARQLGVVAAVLWFLLAGTGLLVTRVWNDTWLGRADRQLVRHFVEVRREDLTRLVEITDTLAGTRTVIAVGVAASVLAVALLRSRRPVVFLVTSVAGETLLYFLTAQVVRRTRPPVPDLTSDLAETASWPSGHMAASIALYGGLAALVIVYGSGRWRSTVIALPLLIAAISGTTRLYVAAHYPTDLLAGFVLGTAWVVACARLVLRAGRSGSASTRSGRAGRPAAAGVHPVAPAAPAGAPSGPGSG